MSGDGRGFHAGMDRMTVAMKVSPPTRGWTPRASDPWADGWPVSPPTRGWTSSRRPSRAVSPPTRDADYARSAGGVHGFPAHAGMDRPERCSVGGTVPRVSPPTRGWTCSCMASATRIQYGRISPPTRGWTPIDIELDAACRRSGFPAHAGMDRRQHRWLIKLRDARVSPPTRGWTRRHRRPVIPRMAATVSPPTRGWTSHRSAVDRQLGIEGFPAHAGMDPDGPGRAIRRAGILVSPPTRGWTSSSGAARPGRQR